MIEIDEIKNIVSETTKKLEDEMLDKIKSGVGRCDFIVCNKSFMIGDHIFDITLRHSIRITKVSRFDWTLRKRLSTPPGTSNIAMSPIPIFQYWQEILSSETVVDRMVSTINGYFEAYDKLTEKPKKLEEID